MLGLKNTVRKIFGTQNDRELKKILPLVSHINDLEAKFKLLNDLELKAKTPHFKERIDNGEPLDSILPEAFAVGREAAFRALGMRPYDVQLIGGITLHRGRIAEMKTGEGKTLVATLPCYLNGLSGKGVHVITVNDYLAKRDAEWMGAVHKFMGLTVGNIVHGLSDKERQDNYGRDITYGTNNEFGFDYLRDNMKFRLKDYVQKELNFAIVDEVDSILIDEARTPLIISGPSDDSTDLYYIINSKMLAGGFLEKDKDFTVDEKSKTAVLSEPGVDEMEKRLGVSNLYDPKNIELLHHVNQALRAHVLFSKDVDYVVRDDEVMIVDEFTGRLMPGRRWSDGLHQAIEAKEGVTIESENQTLATITFQNYFRMYNKLSGMTGTADTEATEFAQIYKLQVTVIPTNRSLARTDEPDTIFKEESGKFKAIVAHIKELQAKGQPTLVGTISVEKSEKLGELMTREGIKHNVLNAKQHAREAEVVAQAGRKGTVTISTNMAGRGTDIVLGGDPEKLTKAECGPPPRGVTEAEEEEYQRNFDESLERWKVKCANEKKEVIEAGGLFILGTERHESRRIDNQLRGRAGRQGDPGASRFYLSLQDDLMRIFGSVNIARFMEDDMPIEHKLVTRAIANAQKKVEGHNYDVRKHLLEYDDVMNQQRKVVYTWRKEVLSRDDLSDMIFSMVEELANAIAQDFFPNGKLPNIDGQARLKLKELNDAVTVTFQIHSNITEEHIDPFNDIGLKDLITKMARSAYKAKAEELGPDNLRQLERMILLGTIDQLWKDHLLAMDHLREGIGLQGYGQKDPLVEYKKQGFGFFEMMMGQITGDVVRKVFAVQIAQVNEDGEEESEFEFHRAPQAMELNVTRDGDLIPQKGGTPDLLAAAPGGLGGPRGRSPMGNAGMAPVGLKPVQSSHDKVGRNDPCPCGSGKKFKKCHGK